MSLTGGSAIHRVSLNIISDHPIVEFDCKSAGVGLPMAENPMFEFFGARGYEDKHRSFKVDSCFEEFKGQHGRQYETEGEEAKRKTHFRHNHR